MSKEAPNYGSVGASSPAMTNEMEDTTKEPHRTKQSSQRQQEQQQQQNGGSGILFIMLGAFCFSFMFLLIKVMKNVNTFTLVFYRSVIPTLISLAAILYKGENPLGPVPSVDNDGKNHATRFYLVLRALFGATAVCMWFFGIQVLPLPDAVTLQFTTPPFAAAFAVCMVGEPWLPLDIIGAIVCLSGVALIAHPTWLFGAEAAATDATEQDDNETGGGGPSMFLQTLAVLITTGGAAFAGLAYVCVRKIGQRASADVMVFYYGAVSIPMTILGSGFLLGEWNVWGGNTFSLADWAILLLIGICGYCGQLLTNIGLQRETAASASLATSTQIVWTFVFELSFLHEAINVWSLTGTGLILGYMFLVGALKLCGGGSEVKVSNSACHEREEPETVRLLFESNSSVLGDVESGTLIV